MKHRVTNNGHISRFEEGELCRYNEGMLIELTDEEAVKWASITEPVGEITPEAIVEPETFATSGELAQREEFVASGSIAFEHDDSPAANLSDFGEPPPPEDSITCPECDTVQFRTVKQFGSGPFVVCIHCGATFPVMAAEDIVPLDDEQEE